MGTTYRQILRSTSIIGSASVINIVVGLLRMKAAAVLLGPAGVGLIGLFVNLVGTATTISGLGLGTVGTRQVAEASSSGDVAEVAHVRRALFLGTLLLAVLGGAAFWGLRHTIAAHVLDDASLGSSLGWLAFAVAASVAAASQNALLNGLRRIGDIARVSIGAALLSTVIAIWAVWALGPEGIVVFVIAGPLASLLLGHWYVAQLPRTSNQSTSLKQLGSQWRTMARLGSAFVVAGIAGTVGQLVVRAVVQRDLGTESLGHFQAAWAISMTYIGFVLGAMGTDYYPRLMAVIRNSAEVNRMVNEQTEVALLLATPVLLVMLGLAPWVIRWLYSAEFAPAADILRWQILGDFLKVASWPLGFILLASGSGKTFMLTEWMSASTFVLLTLVLLPVLGINATGLAFTGMYLVLLPVVYWLAARASSFSWSKVVVRIFVMALTLGLGTIAASSYSNAFGASFGVMAAVGFGGYALIYLAHSSGASGPVGRMASVARRMMIKAGVWREQ